MKKYWEKGGLVIHKARKKHFYRKLIADREQVQQVMEW